ncbi:hypothetical protein GCM10010467_14730 [Actinocorallia glomerata]|uniref:ATP-grasp domain-containing protein n=2 Tax=Actinomycetes TaxID=1760 RepID=A0ABP6M2U8_9MICC
MTCTCESSRIVVAAPGVHVVGAGCDMAIGIARGDVLGLTRAAGRDVVSIPSAQRWPDVRVTLETGSATGTPSTATLHLCGTGEAEAAERLSEAYAEGLLEAESQTDLIARVQLISDPIGGVALQWDIDDQGGVAELPARPDFVAPGWVERAAPDFAVRSTLRDVTQILEYEARRRGLQVSVLDNNLVLTESQEGRHAYLYSSSDTAPYTAHKGAGNKHLARLLLQRRDVSVAPGVACRREEDFSLAQSLLRKHSRLVVKPSNGSKGRGVTVGVVDEAGLRRAWDLARETAGEKGSVLVEQQFTGSEARFSVVGGAVRGVVRRIPPTLVGDGTSTIQQLLRRRNLERRASPHLWSRLVRMDPHRIDRLAQAGLTLSTVLGIGERYVIDHKAGLSSGAASHEALDETHPSYGDVAVQAVRAIPGLQVAGVDIMAHDFSQPAAPDNYIVVELNHQPGVGGHHFPASGRPRNVVGAILDLHELPSRHRSVGSPSPHSVRPPTGHSQGIVSAKRHPTTMTWAEALESAGFSVEWLAPDYIQAVRGDLVTVVWRGFTMLTGKAGVSLAQSRKAMRHVMAEAGVEYEAEAKTFRRRPKDIEAVAERSRRRLLDAPAVTMQVDAQRPRFVDPNDREAFHRTWRLLCEEGTSGLLVRRHKSSNLWRVLVSHGESVAIIPPSGLTHADTGREWVEAAERAVGAIPGLDVAEAHILADGRAQRSGDETAYELLAIHVNPPVHEFVSHGWGEHGAVVEALVAHHVRALQS